MLGLRFHAAAFGAALVVLAPAPVPAQATDREVGRGRVRAGLVRLVVDAAGVGHVVLGRPGEERPIPCDRLTGAWGLWVADVDRDGAPELVIALRKPARFDPVVENRLHVYYLVEDRCVPAWRGSRLAGRFDRLSVGGDRLLALERVGGGRQRIARYRWAAFGYRVEKVLWTGRGRPDAAWLAALAGKED